MEVITGQLVYRITPRSYSYCALWPDAAPVGVEKDGAIYLFTDATRELLADARRRLPVMRIGGVVLMGAFG